MRLFQLLASSPTSLSTASSSSIPGVFAPPTAPPSGETSPAPSATVSVPFFSIGGFAECSWYRRAICIADEFVRTQLEQPQQPNDAEATHSTCSTEESALPQHTRVQSVTLPRQLYRHYLLSLKQHIELGDHYSCPVILRGSCTLTGTASQHACKPKQSCNIHA